ncbi:unnamed protein product [Candida verbasci]|uniref:Ribosome biogenesis protein SLX9 n=1 Tax=Candida verbasci TaxID=1227364 RepID=A0A9W4TSW8_9ASCO|nr:unnamed protein product [Candida verbasci]
MPGIKKKSSLRDKSNSRKAHLSSKISEFRNDTTPNDDTYHENPMLKLAKTTKKEKQQNKSDKFINHLMNKSTFNTSGTISKSALRRKKRKEKEQLKPKMNELLMNLPTDGNEINEQDKVTKIVRPNSTEYIKSSKLNLNRPNPTKSTGLKQIMKEEHKNFNNVLTNPDFRASPFDALKNAIKQNMK